MISAILASTSQGGIGNRGTLPWPKHTGDMEWFREHTLKNVVVMGRRTWDDPKMPKPLPDRINCVFTNRDIGVSKVRRLYGDITEEIKKIEQQFSDREILVIGGKELFDATEDIVQRVYLTRMKNNYWCDTRINLEKYLRCFRLKTVRPGQNCTFEIWDRVFF